VSAVDPETGGVVEALASQARGQLGAAALAVWLLDSDGALRLLGESGFGPDSRAGWRRLEPGTDSPAQRVAGGEPGRWWPGGPPDGSVVLGPAPGGTRAVVGLFHGDGRDDLLGVLEVGWNTRLDPVPADLREQLDRLAAGGAAVLAGGCAATESDIWRLLDQLAGPVLVVRAVRGREGGITDFRIAHVSDGYPDPQGRGADDLTGTALSAAYPDTHLFSTLNDVLHGRQVTGIPAAARLFDGAVLSWRDAGEPGRLAALLENTQRIGRLGGWEEDLRTGTVYWTDSVFTVFGLAPGEAARPIGIGDLHNYVVAADRAGIVRFREALLGGQALNASFRIVRPDEGSVRQMIVAAEPVTDASGTVTAVRGTYQDVSALYQTQIALAATRDRLVDTEQRAAAEHELALRLQHAIMPPDEMPVTVDGVDMDVDVAVRYRPAGAGHLVGGDWYDTLPLPSGEVLVVVGDVAGHGIDAVTGMVAVRNSLRGLAVTGKGPEELVALLNGLVCHLTEGVIGTMICGLYDPASRVLRWARAGHLPPVLVRDGSASALALPDGLLLGMDPDARYEPVRTVMRPGDVLLLFTDGLIERRDEPISDALEEFTATAATVVPGATAAVAADRLLATATSDTADDACLVAIRIKGPAARLRGGGRLVGRQRLPGDPVPRVAGAGAVGGGDAVGLQHHGLGEQVPDTVRQERGATGRHQDAGGAIDHGVRHGVGPGPAERDDRGAARHGLQRDHAGRLVLGGVDVQVGGPQQRRQGLLVELADRVHAVGDVQLVRERGETARRAAGHDEFGIGHPGHRVQQRVERLGPGGLTDGQQPRVAVARGRRTLGRETLGVHAARDHPDVPARHAEPGQVGGLAGVGGEHRVGGAADGGLKPDALGRGGDPVPPLGHPEGGEGLHNRQPEVPARRERGQARGPAHRVHDIGALGVPALAQLVGTGRHTAERAADLVHGDLVSSRGQLACQFAGPDVIVGPGVVLRD
jgi:serine phosphatase RsbU (regulator of sigma subunit)/PAS domain-containing protein